MSKTVTLWAYSADDLETLQGALQSEFGNQMHVTEPAYPVKYRIEGEDHERHVGYTRHVSDADLESPGIRYIAKIGVDDAAADNATLASRMKAAVEAISENRQASLVDHRSVSLGKTRLQLVETAPTDSADGHNHPALNVEAFA